MKILAVALGVALLVAVAANVWQAVPSGSPSKPVYVQRLEQLLTSTSKGDWKEACDASPTAAYNLNDYIMLALQYGVTTYPEAAKLCEALIKSSATDPDNKTPLGLTYEILWYSPDDGKASPLTDRLVIVSLKWKGEAARTVTFHMQLARIPWNPAKAKCKGKPCASLRWYVLGAT